MSLDMLGEVLGGAIRDQETLKTELIQPGTVTTRFIFGFYRLKTAKIELKIQSQTIGNSFILGHADNGVLGSDLLGANSLGSLTTEHESYVKESFTDDGKAEIGKWVNSESATAPNRIAFGSGNTAYNSTDSSLDSEEFRIVIETTSIGTASSGALSTTLTGYIGADVGVIGLKEYGLITGTSGGVLYNREVFSTLTTATTKIYTVTLKYEISDATTGRGMITNAGIQEIGNWLGNTTATAPIQTAWGTGTTNPAYTDTTLEGEQERNVFITQSRIANVVKFEGILTFTEANSNILAKSGVFNAASGGDLILQQKFPPFSKTGLFQVYETDKLTII